MERLLEGESNKSQHELVVCWQSSLVVITYGLFRARQEGQGDLRIILCALISIKSSNLFHQHISLCSHNAAHKHKYMSAQINLI